MGVPGLVTFCRRNKCFEEIDLVSFAKEHKDLEILVDFYGIEQHIMELTLKNLSYRYRNEYLIIPGAEYDEMIIAFREFNDLFKNIGIKLVYICDGPKGLDMYNQQHKAKSWDSRFNRNVETNENYLAYCKNPQRPTQIIRETILRPCLMIDIFKTMIIEDGGEVISLIFGEADHQIANLRRERGSWAVLTNDSDFFIFNQCLTIQIGFFDLDRDLRMGRCLSDKVEGVYCNVRPDRLIVGVVNNRMLQTVLQLTSHSQLIDYSILMGNDYTISFAAQLRDHCQIEWRYDDSHIPDSRKVVQWICDQKTPLIENAVFHQFSESHPEYRNSVQFSMDFYNQSLHEPVLSFTCVENEKLWSYLEERYKSGEISNVLLLAFHGFIYQRNCVEPLTPTDINTLLNDLRSTMYSLCLQYGMTSVTEYQVPRVENNTRILAVRQSNIKLNNFNQDPLHFFETNWSAIDSKNNPNKNVTSLNYFNRFGVDIGFCCYCLRTLWHFTTPHHDRESALILSENEFRAVFCAVFYRLLNQLATRSLKYEAMRDNFVTQYPNSWFFSLKICQSAECETAQEWIQVIYNVAYNQYGKGLKISKQFPDASSFISGTVLSAFFQYVHTRGQRLEHLDSCFINDIYCIMDSIYDEFRDVYNAITDPFEE